MRYVKYVGLSHIRQITAQDWRQVGITADTVQWSARNGFAVPIDFFTDDQVKKVIEPDPGFVITGEGEDTNEEEFVPQPQGHDMTPSQLDQTVEQPVDVVTGLGGTPAVSTTGSGAVGAPGGAAPTTTSTGPGSGSDTPR